jgi:hypothetical protein
VPKLPVFFKAPPKDCLCFQITYFAIRILFYSCVFPIRVCLHTCVPNGCAAGDKIVFKLDVCSEDSMSTDCKIVSCHVQKTFPMGQVPRKR